MRSSSSRIKKLFQTKFQKNLNQILMYRPEPLFNYDMENNMVISYDQNKQRFVARGNKIAREIEKTNRHERFCKRVAPWHYDKAKDCYFTKRISEIRGYPFSDFYDESVTAEILRRDALDAAPFVSISFSSGKFLTVGGGIKARAELEKLGWKSRGAYKGMTCSDMHIVHISNVNQLFDGVAKREFAAWKEKFDKQIAMSSARTTSAHFPVPAGLEYLDFQRAGIELCLQPGNKILADEMGLGKTIQAIGVANALQAKRVLVVCPASLKLNWFREIEKWKVSNIPVSILKSDALSVPEGFVIVNYDILNKTHKILRLKWDLIVFDESHYLKSDTSLRTQMALGESVERAKARMVKLLAKKIKNSFGQGDIKAVAKALGVDKKTVEPYLQMKRSFTLESIVEQLGEYVIDKMRRAERAFGLKAAKILFLTGTPLPNRPAELFPMLKRIGPSGMGGKRQWFLDRYCPKEWHSIRREWRHTGAAHTEELADYLRYSCLIRRMKRDVIKSLPKKTRQILQIAAQPSVRKLLRDELDKSSRIQEITQQLTVVDQTFYDQIDALRSEAHDLTVALAILRRLIGMSKAPYVAELVSLALESGTSKVVVMAHHKSVIAMLMEALKVYKPVKVNGEMKIEDRNQSVENFQNEPNCRVFIGSIHVAGLGITLTAATLIAFAELDWTPGCMLQAEERAHRIGQRQNVHVQYIVFAGSLDVQMCKTLKKKEVVIASVLGDSK